jgi:hypothetical protein
MRRSTGVWVVVYTGAGSALCVDREEYLRRDREVQRALERMVTKDELRDVNDTLRSIQSRLRPIGASRVSLARQVAARH